MIVDVREVLECLSGDSSVSASITRSASFTQNSLISLRFVRLEELLAERLRLTQRLLDHQHHIFYQNYNTQL